MAEIDQGLHSAIIVPRLDVHASNAPPRRSSLKPASIDMSRINGHAQGHLLSQAVVPLSEMTPPLTPASYSSGHSQEAPASPASIGELPAFHNYLRAFYPFHPTSNVDSVGEESSVIVPINQGDVILIHSVQPNGWADGTLLVSGARGWLPTNYCEPYDHDAIRPLLIALTNVWEFIHGHDENESTVFAKQDYVRGLIAGVRQFLDRVQCLSKECPTVQGNPNIRRTRRGLLSELSSFAKAAKALQEECQRDIPPEALLQLLDEAVLKAYRVVTRAVRLLDIWLRDSSPNGSCDIDLQAPTVRIMQPLTPPSEIQDCQETQRPATEPLENPNKVDAVNSSTQQNFLNTTQSSVFEATAQHSYNLRGSENDSGYANPEIAYPDAQPSQTLQFDFTQLTSPAAADFSNNIAAPSQNPPELASSPNSSRPSFRPPSTIFAPCVRPLSIAQKRASASHRLSYGPRAPVFAPGPLALERLTKSHDAFISSLGAFVGLHLQSRSSMDLLMSTQQSVSACQELLAVVDEVWDRDFRRSDLLSEARAVMYSSLSELVQATRSLLQDPDDAGVSETVAADQGERLIQATTCCVRAAGDCIAKSKAIIERIGDFVLEQVGLGISEASEVEQPLESPKRDQHSRQSSDDSSAAEDDASEAASEDTSTASSSATETCEENTQPLASPARPPPPPPPPHHPDSDRLTPTPLNIPTMPRASSDTVVPRYSSELEFAPANEEVHSTFDFDIPTSSLDLIHFPEPPKGPLANENKDRSESFGVSVSESISTGQSSFRNSGTSLPSQTSTRATTPDRDAQMAAMAGSFGSLDSQLNLSDEADDGEAALMETTYAHELIFNRDGQVSGGSLPALVEKLTTHDSTPDAQFVNAFYLTFRLFTTPVEFAQALVDRFDYVADQKNVATPVRLRVYNVFKGWLESHWSPASDADALKVILPFAIGRLRAALPSASQRLIDLTTKISDPKDGALVPRLTSSVGKTSIAPTPAAGSDAAAPSSIINKSQLNLLRNTNSGSATCSILDFDAMEIARQLTLMEAKMYCAIQPEELLALEWTKKTSSKATNVKAMSGFSTQLANLVAESILQFDEPKKRAAMIKKWIKIESKCFDLKNYDSLLAIHCSLDSSTVIRLKRTWDLLPAKTANKFEDLKKVCDMSRNYVGLRQRLQNQVAPCIPFVGVYLTDLTFVDAGNQSTRQLPQDANGESVSVINFDKHMKTAKIIGDLQRFQIPYKLTPVPEMQDWIDAQIHRVRNSQSNVHNFYRRSCFLEPREQQPRLSPQESASSSFASNASVTSGTSRESTKERFELWSALHFGTSSKDKNAST